MAQQFRSHDVGSADIRQKRIHIELEMLKHLNKNLYEYSMHESVLGLHIIVSSESLASLQFEIDSRAVKSELVDKQIEKFMFEVLLDHRFPFQQPQIMCLTQFSQPPLNDGRDLFNDILKSDWQIAKKLYEIVQYIPEFIQEVKINESAERPQMFGTFHLGYLYNIESTWTPAQIFDCEEMDEQDDELFYPRRLVITPSALLIFELHKHQENLGMLVSWATLNSLDRVRRNVTSRPEMITLLWRSSSDQGARPWPQNLFILKGRQDECLNYLVKAMADMGVGIEKTTKNQSKIMESEVTKEAIAQMDINQLTEHIEDYEDEIASYDLSLSAVQTLTTLYQKAIEYYSALDDLENTTDYLGRMQALLAREDIQIVLKSYEDEKLKQQNNLMNELAKAQADLIGPEQLAESTVDDLMQFAQNTDSLSKPAIDFDVGDEDEPTHTDLTSSQSILSKPSGMNEIDENDDQQPGGSTMAKSSLIDSEFEAIDEAFKLSTGDGRLFTQSPDEKPKQERKMSSDSNDGHYQCNF